MQLRQLHHVSDTRLRQDLLVSLLPRLSSQVPLHLDLIQKHFTFISKKKLGSYQAVRPPASRTVAPARHWSTTGSQTSCLARGSPLISSVDCDTVSYHSKTIYINLQKYLGPDSYHSKQQASSDMCRDLHCRREHYTWTSHPALEGTSCGPGRWCRSVKYVKNLVSKCLSITHK